jgi:hypothetical protein
MDPLDAFWHLANLLLPALAQAALTAALAKLLWRRDLAGVSWRRLTLGAAVAGVLVTIGGLLLSGRDGRMATYGALVLVNALALWWFGFGPGRRRG